MNDHGFLGPAAEWNATLTEAWDNGNIAIETWTLPSGNVPFVTSVPESTFTHKLANYRLYGVLIDKLTTGVPLIQFFRAGRYHRPILDSWMLERQRDPAAEEEG